VVLELIEAGAMQAVKLSGLSTVMVLGITGTTYMKYAQTSFLNYDLAPLYK